MDNIALNIIFSILLLIGILLTCKMNNFNSKKEYNTFLLSSFLYVFFINLSTILSDIGAANVEYNLANSIKTCVVLVYTWIIVFLKKKSQLVFEIKKVDFIHMFLIGLFIVASYFCYCSALKQNFDNIVILIVRLNFIIEIILGIIFLKEKHTLLDVVGWIIITLAFVLIAMFC